MTIVSTDSSSPSSPPFPLSSTTFRLSKTTPLQRIEEDWTYSTGASHVSLYIFIRLLCLCWNVISLSLKNPISSQYFLNLCNRQPLRSSYLWRR